MIQCRIWDGVNVMKNSKFLKAEQVHLKANVLSMAAVVDDMNADTVTFKKSWRSSQSCGGEFLVPVVPGQAKVVSGLVQCGGTMRHLR